MTKFSIELVQAKRAELEACKAKLKTEFFGLDIIIDRVIDSMYAWYAFPQLITRPVIVNLWGMTGVGKTQLVRRLVQILGLSNSFVEIQMDGFSQGGSWHNKISDILENSSISEGQTGVLLLDEIQRYRTVGKQNEDVDIKRYQDIWMLLSDGKLSVDAGKFREIEDMFLIKAFDKDNPNNPEGDGDTETPVDEPGGPRKFKIRPWQARQFKRLLKIPNQIEDIMTWTYEDVLEYAKSHQHSNSAHEVDYSKLLIFISGNLDEVYTSAGQTGDSDTDADIYHELSSKITTNEVKDALRKRFQPEQISRFGNNHVIYPSLSKHSYQMIIKTTCDRYVADMAKLTGINFILSQNILDEIYVNSVYPTQGTRPVFSSIHKIFSSALTMIAVWGLENNHNYIFLDIDVERRVILGISDRDDQKETTEVPVDLDIRTNKAMTTEDFITMISVHEAGHGLVMMLTNGEVPKEINVSLAAWKGGYTYQSPHDVTTREQLVNEMMMGLGGGTAERVVFGRDNQSSGNATDLNRVTTLASNYVRSYGFGNNSSYIHLGDDPLCNTDVLETNKEVEDLVHRCRNATTTLLVDNKEYLMRLVDALIAKRQIGQDEIIAMFPELNLVPCKIVKYRELWNAFKA